MPFVLLAIVLTIVVVLIAVASIPLSILQRYRLGTARRPARNWVASINLVAIAISAAILLVLAGVSSPWVPSSIPYTLSGLAAGALLGFLGLAVTRWTREPHSLFYQPNRWLVLTITLVVLARLFYGFWRGWRAWQASGDSSWLAQAGAAGSMAAGGVVIGYYLVYWAGVRRKVKRDARQMHG